MEIQTEELPKGNTVTLETLANGQLQNKLDGILANLSNNEIMGEYKDYHYTIDNHFHVEIGEKIIGIKPEGVIEILNQNYTFQPIQVKLTTSITEGSITSIQTPDGVNLITNVSDTEKIYEISKSGTYSFILTSNTGRKASINTTIQNILETPKISIQNITSNSFSIQVDNPYPENVITEYKYYLNNSIIYQGTTNKNYTVTGLSQETEYTNIKVIAYIHTENKESNTVTTKTDKKLDNPTIQVESQQEKLPLEYPILTKKGMMTCYSPLRQGDNALLTVTNQQENVTNYYSVDKGSTWIKYDSPIVITYPGTGNLLAKSSNNAGNESDVVTATVEERQYFYDRNILPTASDALDIAAYDKDDTTFYEAGSNKNSFYFGSDIDIYQVCFKIDPTYSGVIYSDLNSAGCILVTEGVFIGDGIFHTIHYGKNTNAWQNFFTRIDTKLYEIYYDGNIP